MDQIIVGLRRALRVRGTPFKHKMAVGTRWHHAPPLEAVLPSRAANINTQVSYISCLGNAWEGASALLIASSAACALGQANIIASSNHATPLQTVQHRRCS